MNKYLTVVFLIGLTLQVSVSAQLNNSNKKNANSLSNKEKKQGWELMFDGTSFKGWRGYNRQDIPPVWIIENGTMKVESSKAIRGDRNSTGDIIYYKQFRNFEFSFEWKISENGNSGIFFLAEEIPGQAIYASSPEYQLLDNQGHPDGKLGVNGNRLSASLYDMIPAFPQNANMAMQWNSGSILCKDGKVIHYQNGVKVVEYNLWGDEWKKLIENSKFKGWPHMINIGGDDKQGFIGLQYHGDNIWFRNLKIREL